MAAQKELMPLVDKMVEKLLSVKKARVGTIVRLEQEQIAQVCMAVREIFLKQPMLVETDAPINICGDTHGQYYDLLRLLEIGEYPPKSKWLFMGDYVDRSNQSVETMVLLFCFKIKHPDKVFLLRGNHECASINRIYGFYDECKRRYSVKLWRMFVDVFNCMPCAALVAKRVLCMHGGISPELLTLDKINAIKRPVDIPDFGLLCDLLWSDPDPDITGWGMNDRGVSYTFGSDIIIKFCEKHDLDLICRAHQVVEDGYEFQARRHLVTIFSAPNYCGEFDNAAGMLRMRADLMCSFEILRGA